ncbi:MAG TPA: hypothetical protein VHB68_02170, partial [Steroidobacteraceae bacterium]|nr:hypothetical protein [Steroidobacteraceae bacterium]
MGIKERTHHPAEPDPPGALIGDCQAILSGVANILVRCGYSPGAIDREMARICGALEPPDEPFDRRNLEYVARLPDVIADWNELPRFVQDGKP